MQKKKFPTDIALYPQTLCKVCVRPQVDLAKPGVGEMSQREKF